ncbi:MAG TPA: glutamate--tRNA ligase [Candidatus Acidoferrales bacterium]|jgi:glutamyl-tRNA synthetase|nr:glutamate--tRNA ligase [Candidatus Acidoferrales bacterium]
MASVQKPRVRFAPSPTGYLHVGGARTALFNWLFARHEGGTLLLRIEDTDVGRNRPELIDGILDDLKWLGIEWDEGPFFQSQRLEMYQASAERLLASGAAFSCYCKASAYAGGDAAPAPGGDAEEKEGEGDDEGPKSQKGPACPCRDLSAADRAAKEKDGLQRAIRFRVPRIGTTQFEDIVFGPREVQNEEIEDFVLLRSNGLPTYQLSVVVDDIDMHITHVIRGADHLSNTPKQALLYEALGAPVPLFAHVPLILGPDRTRLSKRHGATSVGSYAKEGFLPEAFRNFLALLGWSPGGDAEILRTPQMVERFTLAGVSRTNAVFDRPKLEWFNTEYQQKLPIEDLLPHVEAELKRAGLWEGSQASQDRGWFARTVELIRPRTRLLGDFTGWARAFFADDFDYETEAREKFWKDERLPGMFSKLADALAALPDWNHDACDATLRGLATAQGVKAGLLINATRVAIVGRAVAPPLFDTMVALGKERVVTRLRRAVTSLGSK